MQTKHHQHVSKLESFVTGEGDEAGRRDVDQAFNSFTGLRTNLLNQVDFECL